MVKNPPASVSAFSIRGGNVPNRPVAAENFEAANANDEVVPEEDRFDYEDEWQLVANEIEKRAVDPSQMVSCPDQQSGQPPSQGQPPMSVQFGALQLQPPVVSRLPNYSDIEKVLYLRTNPDGELYI